MPTSFNVIDRLYCAADQLRIVGDDETADLLAEALRSHLADGQSLDVGLGLTGDFKGSSSPRFEYMRRERNQYLRDALWQADGSYTRLAEEIRRFEARLWPMYRYRADTPPDWPPMRLAIWRAFRSMPARMPATAKGLRETLAWK